MPHKAEHITPPYSVPLSSVELARRPWTSYQKTSYRLSVSYESYRHTLHTLITLHFLSHVFEWFCHEQSRTLSLSTHPATFTKPEWDNWMKDARVKKAARELPMMVLWLPKKARWHATDSTALTQDKDLEQPKKIGEFLEQVISSLSSMYPAFKRVLPSNLSSFTPQETLQTWMKEISQYSFADCSPTLQLKSYLDLWDAVQKEAAIQDTYASHIEYATPSVAKLMIACLDPLKGHIYDPAMGQGNLLTACRAKTLLQESSSPLHFYGEENCPQLWQLARLKLIVMGLVSEAELSQADEPKLALNSSSNTHLKVDTLLSCPPFTPKPSDTELLLSTQKSLFSESIDLTKITDQEHLSSIASTETYLL